MSVAAAIPVARLVDRRRDGYFRIDDALIDHAVLSPYQLAVYVCLCRHANKEGASFPSHATIAREMNMSVREVVRRLKELLEEKLVTWTRTGGANTYTLEEVPTASEIRPMGTSEVTNGHIEIRPMGRDKGNTAEGLPNEGPKALPAEGLVAASPPTPPPTRALPLSRNGKPSPGTHPYLLAFRRVYRAMNQGRDPRIVWARDAKLAQSLPHGYTEGEVEAMVREFLTARDPYWTGNLSFSKFCDQWDRLARAIRDPSPSSVVPDEWKDAPWPSPAALAHLYNEAAPDNVPAVETLSEERQRKAQVVLAQFPSRQWWVDLFKQFRRSPFLNGQIRPGKGHAGWSASFDWLLAKGTDGTENCVKVHDGGYAHA